MVHKLVRISILVRIMVRLFWCLFDLTTQAGAVVCQPATEFLPVIEEVGARLSLEISFGVPPPCERNNGRAASIPIARREQPNLMARCRATSRCTAR